MSIISEADEALPFFSINKLFWPNNPLDVSREDPISLKNLAK